MRSIPLVLLVAALLAAPAAAAPPAPAALSGPGAVETASELVRLDRILCQAQWAAAQGRIAPERYREFMNQFRAALAEAAPRRAASVGDAAAWARIQARLGNASGALAALGPALARDPDDPELRLTVGDVRYEQGDFPAALAEANAVLARDPANLRALALKHFSAGRAPHFTPAGSLGPLASDERLTSAGDAAAAHRSALNLMREAQARLAIGDPAAALRALSFAEAVDPSLPDVPMRQGSIYFDLNESAKAAERFGQAERLWRIRGTAQAAANADAAREMKRRASQAAGAPVVLSAGGGIPAPSGPAPFPLLPLAGAAFLGLAGYGVSRSKATYESEDGLDDAHRPAYGPGQRFVAGAVLAGLAGAGIYLLGAAALNAAPVVLRTAEDVGSRGLRLAGSEAGAINLGSVGRTEEAAPQAEAAAGEVEQVVLKKGEILNRVWHSEWTKDSTTLSGPRGFSYCRGSCLPINAARAVEARGLNTGVVNNARAGSLYRATEDILVNVRQSLGGHEEEIVLRSPEDMAKLEHLEEHLSQLPPGK